MDQAARLAKLKEYSGRAEHGTRGRYMAGCKCMLCRAANSRYSCFRAAEQRAGRGNGLVSAARARRHLSKLSAAGVGRRAVSDVTGLSHTRVVLIRTGQQKKIRRLTEQKILAVTIEAAADGAYIPAAETHQ